MITSHVWRPPPKIGTDRSQESWDDRPCEYMNCRRLRHEHARATTGRHRSRWAK